MNRFTLHLSITLCLFALPGVVIAQSFIASYGEASTPRLASLQQQLKEKRVLEGIASSYSKGMKLPNQVTISTAECGAPNAGYSHTDARMLICLDLVAYMADGLRQQLASKVTDSEIRSTIAAGLRFITLHELGHVLVHQFSLPILGREEDAADQIAIFFLLRTPTAFEGLAAAMWFFKQNGLIYTRRHFADEHSLGPQRQANLACWAYGHDASKYQAFANTNLLPPERERRCAQEYRLLDRSIRNLLAGHVLLPSN